MERIEVRNEAISASAGSGKTFQLAHRFIRLLALGVAPERIMALTFSRKAGREIFDSIIEHICNAASDEKARRNTCATIGLERGPDDFRDYLACMLRSLHRLNIGTLDSFIVKVLRNFPMEFGLSGAIQLMQNDGSQAIETRNDVFGRIFSRKQSSAEERAAFVSAFTQSTFGAEEKGVARALADLTRLWHDLYLQLPDPEAWGSAARIWPDGAYWFEQEFDIERGAEALLEWQSELGLKGSAADYIPGFIDEVDGSEYYLLDRNHKKKIRYILEHLDLIELLRGDSEINIYRGTYPLSGAARDGMLALLGHVMQTNLLVLLQQTAGIHRMISHYDRAYAEEIAGSGKLTFQDAQMLMAEDNPRSAGRRLSGVAEVSSSDRLCINYRLDGCIDHCLLDEFQDTSDIQWACLKNLVDEIIQDDSGRRSLFYVGDVKQAIYAWRGGNAELFGKLLDRYRGRIDNPRLSLSYRSAPAVIEAVNRVFSDLDESGIPSDVAAKWDGIWQEHQASHEQLTAAVEILQPLEDSYESRSSVSKSEARGEVAAALIERIKPIERGLSTAVLVRTNREAARIVEILRARCPHTPIVHEGPAELVESPVVRLLLSVVALAAHPGDRLARGHLMMSPLAGEFAESIRRGVFSQEILARMQGALMCGFVRDCARRLRTVQSLSTSEEDDLMHLEHAAAEFDAANSPDPDRFLLFIENFSRRQSAAPNAVRVMTIHQSKGLGFDIVVLPELEGGSMLKSHEQKYISSGEEEDLDAGWVLKAPARLINSSDRQLARAQEQIDNAATFDNLCLLYVAMTRAKRGLYMVLTPKSKSSKTYRQADLVREQLGVEEGAFDRQAASGDLCAFDGFTLCGDVGWYEELGGDTVAGERAEEKPALPTGFARRRSSRMRPILIRPSSERSGAEDDAGAIFRIRNSASLVFGSAIHDLFSRVSWLDEMDLEDLLRDWRGNRYWPEKIKENVARQFRETIADPDIAELFKPPPGSVELWCEKGFELLRGNEWVSGVFDRVVLLRDGQGALQRVDLIDYKSNRLDSEGALKGAAESYRPQMEEYRRVLSALLDCPAETIRALLVFTVPARIVEL